MAAERRADNRRGSPEDAERGGPEALDERVVDAGVHQLVAHHQDVLPRDGGVDQVAGQDEVQDVGDEELEWGGSVK